MTKYISREAEFFDNVWDHSKDPFFLDFAISPPINDDEFVATEQLIELIRKRTPTEKRIAELRKLILEKNLGFYFLQLSGLTRNKIVSDVRASMAQVKGGRATPANVSGLAARDSSWNLAGPYLLARLDNILGPLSENPSGIRNSLEAIKRATHAGFMRQEVAKRSGHEAEARLARVLDSCGIKFEPAEKLTNPLCADIQLGAHSFDLVIPNAAKATICVKSTVHTANIGQYGESKDHLEVEAAANALAIEFPEGTPKPILLALIDGIGFKSNRAGLKGVLEKCDEFCQYRTLWKVVLLAAKTTGKALSVDISEETHQKHADFFARHKLDAFLNREDFKHIGETPVGDATIRF